MNLMKSIATFSRRSTMRRILKINFKSKSKRHSENWKHYRNKRKRWLSIKNEIICKILSPDGKHWHGKRRCWINRFVTTRPRRKCGINRKSKPSKLWINPMSKVWRSASSIFKGQCSKRGSITWNSNLMRKEGKNKSYSKIFYKWVERSSFLYPKHLKQMK